ncbi:hypothetical protein SBV1_90024 [Verrucomicrobia bacterium]|nr:hypothetical protein SBV1_90024 [Verrucomicrobiota bacterium]
MRAFFPESGTAGSSSPSAIAPYSSGPSSFSGSSSSGTCWPGMAILNHPSGTFSTNTEWHLRGPRALAIAEAVVLSGTAAWNAKTNWPNIYLLGMRRLEADCVGDSSATFFLRAWIIFWGQGSDSPRRCR